MRRPSLLWRWRVLYQRKQERKIGPLLLRVGKAARVGRIYRFDLALRVRVVGRRWRAGSGGSGGPRKRAAAQGERPPASGVWSRPRRSPRSKRASERRPWAPRSWPGPATSLPAAPAARRSVAPRAGGGGECCRFRRFDPWGAVRVVSHRLCKDGLGTILESTRTER